MSKEHNLKSWTPFFVAIRQGTRFHELRRNDRDYKVGDICVLREFDPATAVYSGDVLRVEVTSITSASVPCAVSIEALNPEFCILSVRQLI